MLMSLCTFKKVTFKLGDFKQVTQPFCFTVFLCKMGVARAYLFPCQELRTASDIQRTVIGCSFINAAVQAKKLRLGEAQVSEQILLMSQVGLNC